MADQKTPTPTQAENDATRASKERAEKSAKEVQERTAKAYEIETPTPTQAEADEAMLAAMHQQDLPEGSGMSPTPSQLPAEAPQDTKRKTVEAEKPGGYQTRAATPAKSE